MVNNKIPKTTLKINLNYTTTKAVVNSKFN